MKSATPVIAQQTAIVIGASMAGLLAAAALAPLYRRVLVLERDDLRDRSSPRKGVPQAAHVHGFLAAGCTALEQLLPGIVERVEAAGGAVGDMLQDARFYVGREQRFVAGASGIQGLVASRLLPERVVAQAVGALPNVEIRSGVQVSGPLFDSAAQRVAGVICQPHGASDDAQQALPAALVVDASGRGGRSRSWLQQAGYLPPPQDVLPVDITYSSCWFKRDPAQVNPVRAVFVAPDAATPVPAGMMEQDGERWIVSCGSYGDRSAPATVDELREYVRRHSAVDIHAVIADAEPLGPLRQYRYAASVRNRYEKLRRFPHGYLLLGDALCSFNPVYGQGMTIAALQALALRDCLQQGRGRLWRRYFRRAAAIVADPWEFAIASDLGLPCVAGKRPFGFSLVQRYSDRLMRAASRDMGAARAVLRVVHMLDRPGALLAPATVYRALRYGGV